MCCQQEQTEVNRHIQEVAPDKCQSSLHCCARRLQIGQRMRQEAVIAQVRRELPDAVQGCSPRQVGPHGAHRDLGMPHGDQGTAAHRDTCNTGLTVNMELYN